MGTTCSIAKSQNEPAMASNRMRFRAKGTTDADTQDSPQKVGKTSQTSSVISLNKSSQSFTTDSSEDLIVPETKDEVDAPIYNLETEDKSTKSENKTTSIPAKNDDDLKEAKQLIEKYPTLKRFFLGFDSLAVMLSKPINLKDSDNNWIEEIKTNLQWLYFSIDEAPHEKQALGDYLVRINMPEILYNFYLLVMKSLHLEYWTETIFKDNTELPRTAIIFNLRKIFLKYSDCSALFANKLTLTGLFKYYIEDLQAMKDDISDPRKIGFIFESAVGTIHNCSKNPANHHIFDKLNTVSHIIPFLKCDSPILKTIVLRTLVYIIVKDQNELLLADKSIFEFLLKYLTNAWKSSDHRFKGSAVDEIVGGLIGLAKNDENKTLLMEIGSLPILTDIMKSGSDLEKKPAIECIWELSFNKENSKTILADETVVKLLTSLSQSENKGIAKAANGVLWVLKAEEREKKQEEDKKKKSSPEKKAGHIMLSYAWTEQKKVIQVKEYLKRSHYRVWMDVDDMGGSTLQAMAEAVENSAVILICMSERYKSRPNCRIEAEYAFFLKKDIVPLIMEHDYQPDGWLGILKGSKLFFDFSGKYPFETKIENLIKEIGPRGKSLPGAIPMEESNVAVIKSAPLQAGRGATVAEWSSKDVLNWLQKNSLTRPVVDQDVLEINSPMKSLTGEQLEFLHKLSHWAPEFYFGYLERKLGLNDLEQLMMFSKAVNRL